MTNRCKISEQWAGRIIKLERESELKFNPSPGRPLACEQPLPEQRLEDLEGGTGRIFREID